VGAPGCFTHCRIRPRRPAARCRGARPARATATAPQPRSLGGEAGKSERRSAQARGPRTKPNKKFTGRVRASRKPVTKGLACHSLSVGIPGVNGRHPQRYEATRKAAGTDRGIRTAQWIPGNSNAAEPDARKGEGDGMDCNHSISATRRRQGRLAVHHQDRNVACLRRPGDILSRSRPRYPKPRPMDPFEPRPAYGREEMTDRPRRSRARAAGPCSPEGGPFPCLHHHAAVLSRCSRSSCCSLPRASPCG
jgi:hypothetical protein